eukprot:gene12602-9016_t
MSLPFLILALVDVQSSPTNASLPWSSMMYGRNFMSIERSGKRIDFKGGRLSNAQNDPLSDVIYRAQGTREVTPLVIPMAIMGIDFARRRRYRINGYASLDRKQVEAFTPLSLGFTFHVLEAYGNCPKFIQAREVLPLPPASASSAAQLTRSAAVNDHVLLSPEDVALIRQCDTAFVSSYHASDNATTSHRVDISHRGGQRGFIRVIDDTTLAWPEYAGNNMYMTLGNLQATPHAGLLLFDFDDQQRTLQLTGTV